jgi:hypothetical protein
MSAFAQKTFRRGWKAMSLNYAVEKLWEAVDVLATDKHRIKARLERAAVGVAQASGAKDWPPALKAEHRALLDRLTAVQPTANEGAVAATVEQMSEDDAVEIAGAIIALAHKVTDAYRAGG